MSDLNNCCVMDFCIYDHDKPCLYPCRKCSFYVAKTDDCAKISDGICPSCESCPNRRD